MRNVVKGMTRLLLGFAKHDDRRQDQRKRDKHDENCSNSNIDPGVVEEDQKRLLRLSSRIPFLVLLFLRVFLLQTVVLN